MAGLEAESKRNRSLFAGATDAKNESIERTADAIRQKLGSDAIQRASVKFKK